MIIAVAIVLTAGAGFLRATVFLLPGLAGLAGSSATVSSAMRTSLETVVAAIGDSIATPSPAARSNLSELATFVNGNLDGAIQKATAVIDFTADYRAAIGELLTTYQNDGGALRTTIEGNLAQNLATVDRHAQKILGARPAIESVSGFATFLVATQWPLVEHALDDWETPLDEWGRSMTRASRRIEGLSSVWWAVSVISITASCFLIVIAVLATIAYFKANSATRCFFAAFPFVMLILSGVLMAPAVYYSVIFVPISHACETVDGPLRLISEMSWNGTIDLSRILSCVDNVPMAELQIGFPAAIYSAIADQISGLLSGFAAKADAVGLRGFAGEIDPNTFVQPAALIGFAAIPPEANQAAQDTFKTNAMQTNKLLVPIRSALVSLAAFADQVTARTDAAAGLLRDLPAQFVNSSSAALNMSLAEIRCGNWQCAYRDFRDDTCVGAQGGIAWWLFASAFYTVGILTLGIIACLRRRDIKKPTVEADEDDEDPDPDLARFSIGSLL
jgi:hypothetical protein